MAEDTPVRTYISTNGQVTIRQRPTRLLMHVVLYAVEATLELGLKKLRQKGEAASRWLERLNAAEIRLGEPFFMEMANHKDPMQRAQQMAARAMGRRVPKRSSSVRKSEVNMVLTAVWDIASLSAEQTLVLLDRLRFEVGDAEDVDAEAVAENDRWPMPEDLLQEMVEQFNQSSENERSPEFLFITRLDDDRREQAIAEAFTQAQAQAEFFAQAVGRRLVHEPHLIQWGVDIRAFHRPDRMQNRHRLGALLSECSYDLDENEVVSDDPRSAEFPIRIGASYYLEPLADNAARPPSSVG